MNQELQLTPDFKITSDGICYHVFNLGTGKRPWKLVGYVTNIKDVFRICGEKALMTNLNDLKTAMRMIGELKESVEKILSLEKA